MAADIFTTRRLFLGFTPSVSQIAQLAACQHHINQTPSRFRMIAKENFHMTLLFLGNVQQQQMDLLIKRIDELRLIPFQQPLTQLTHWPKPKILCLNQLQVDAPLMQLHQVVSAIAKEINIMVSEHSQYRPHITLARKAHDVPPLLPMQIPQLTLVPNSLNLYQSINLGEGVRYPIIKSWPIIAA